MRPIDADALSARMYHDAFETDSDMQKWDSGCWIRYKMFENAIEDAPTIKPERKTGRWKLEIREGHAYWRCSECGGVVDIAGYAFCPTCGVDMRGENE